MRCPRRHGFRSRVAMSSLGQAGHATPIAGWRGACVRVPRELLHGRSRTAPALPAGVECIGYQPGGPPARPPSIRWGLEYAPVAIDDADPSAERDPTRALVALGGSRDDVALDLVLDVLEGMPEVERIDV